MNLIINGRFLTQRVTGVQRYAIEIVKQLDRIITEKDNVIIACPNQEVNQLNLKNIKIVKTGKLKSHLWEQINLPIFKMKMGYDLLTLSGLSPILSPGYWTLHDITFIRHPESFNLKFRLWYSLVSKINVRRCDAVFTVSNFSKHEVMDYLNVKEKNIVVTYNAATIKIGKKSETDSFNKWDLPRKGYFLSVSSKSPHKNQIFIEKMSKKHPEIKFVIVGGEHKSFAKTGDLSRKNLIYTGYVTDGELSDLYQNAKGFIFPSLYEGFGIPALEAIAYGCNIICVSDIPVFKEIYNEGVNFFDPLDENSLVLDNEKLVSISDEDIAYYKHKFSWRNAASIVINTIDNNSEESEKQA